MEKERGSTEDNVVDKVSTNSEEDTLADYQTGKGFHNGLEDSISLIERTAKKLIPIYKELSKRMVPQKSLEESFLEEEGKDSVIEDKGMVAEPDLRHILGFLNQSEWVTMLNIGNIMQIQPIQTKDML